jgi:carboxypeptidase C (cathepsin A)
LKATDDALSWPRYLNVTPILAKPLRQNPKLRLLVANGLYDLATPFHAVETSLSGNGIDPSRIRMTYYQSGHMIYLHESSLMALMGDLRSLVAGL